MKLLLSSTKGFALAVLATAGCAGTESALAQTWYYGQPQPYGYGRAVPVVPVERPRVIEGPTRYYAPAPDYDERDDPSYYRPRARAQAEARAQAQAQAQQQARAQAEADARAQAEADARTQAQAEAKAHAEVQARAEARAKALQSLATVSPPEPKPVPVVQARPAYSAAAVQPRVATAAKTIAPQPVAVKARPPVITAQRKPPVQETRLASNKHRNAPARVALTAPPAPARKPKLVVAKAGPSPALRLAAVPAAPSKATPPKPVVVAKAVPPKVAKAATADTPVVVPPLLARTEVVNGKVMQVRSEAFVPPTPTGPPSLPVPPVAQNRSVPQRIVVYVDERKEEFLTPEPPVQDGRRGGARSKPQLPETAKP